MTTTGESGAAIPGSHVGILETALLAMVSTVGHRDGLVSTNPVGFDWDGENVRLSTLKSRVKYRNLVSNPQITFCAVDPAVPSRYIEIRGHAQIADDPDRSLCNKLFRRTSGRDMPPEMDGPGAERVIITIIPTRVSTPTLYGGRLDQRAREMAESPSTDV